MGLVRLDHAAQNDAQFRSYVLFISRIFRLIFSDLGSSQVTETVESETGDKGGLLC